MPSQGAGYYDHPYKGRMDGQVEPHRVAPTRQGNFVSNSDDSFNELRLPSTEWPARPQQDVQGHVDSSLMPTYQEAGFTANMHMLPYNYSPLGAFQESSQSRQALLDTSQQHNVHIYPTQNSSLVTSEQSIESQQIKPRHVYPNNTQLMQQNSSVPALPHQNASQFNINPQREHRLPGSADYASGAHTASAHMFSDSQNSRLNLTTVGEKSASRSSVYENPAYSARFAQNRVNSVDAMPPPTTSSHNSPGVTQPKRATVSRGTGQVSRPIVTASQISRSPVLPSSKPQTPILPPQRRFSIQIPPSPAALPVPKRSVSVTSPATGSAATAHRSADQLSLPALAKKQKTSSHADSRGNGASRHLNADSLVALAEELFSEAFRLSADLAKNLTPGCVEVYHKLISAGLACLKSCLYDFELLPRVKARITLRYASLLFEETENLPEAEASVNRAIEVSDQHKLVDLKYTLQFLLAKMLFKSAPKAAFKTLETAIENAVTYKHIPWVYASRFLSAQLLLELGMVSAVATAVQQYRSIAALASERRDLAIFGAASIMEVIAHFRSPGSDSAENAKRALAAARTYQLDEGSRVSQVVFLTQCYDTLMSFMYGGLMEVPAKLKTWQLTMDAISKGDEWNSSGDSMSIPFGVSGEYENIVTTDSKVVLDRNTDDLCTLKFSLVNLKDAMALT
jgi:hypothetical protein